MKLKPIPLYLIVVGLVLIITTACNKQPSGEEAGNMTLFNQETALDTLSDATQVLAILDSKEMSIYWLNLDNHQLYLATSLARFDDRETYNIVPEKDMMVWTGSQIVYGGRLQGFFSLAADGTIQQLTDFDVTGRLARNGEQILRFKTCDFDEAEEGMSYSITPLDRFTEKPLVCVPRELLSEPGAWYVLEPIWNPYLPHVDFLLSKRFGKGDQMVIQFNRLAWVREKDGALLPITNLGKAYPEWVENDIQPRPDSQAFYIHNAASGASRIIDRGGKTLVDLATVNEQLPHLQRNRRFSWAPDSQGAILEFKDCPESSETGACKTVLVWATDNFQSLKEVATLPPNYRFSAFIWSPDSTHLGLVTQIHQSADDPPRIYTINLTDQTTAEYIFPIDSNLKNVQWVR